MEWYKRLGFESTYYPPGFAILRRDEIQIIADNIEALYSEYSSAPGVTISRPLCPQEHGMMEFDVMDLNGHRLVFAQPIPAN